MDDESEYMTFTNDNSPILEFVIRTHLYIENHLRKLLAEKLIKPELVITQGAPSSSQLINLCEAIGATDTELSRAVRLLNAIRNKYAHRLSYEALESEADAFITQLRSIDGIGWYSYIPGNEYEFGLAVNALGGYFERKFGKLGLTFEKRLVWLSENDESEDT